MELSGVVPSLQTLGDRPTAGLIVRGVGEWAWVVKTLGMTVSWVWAQKEDWLPTCLKSELPEVVMTTNRNRLSTVNVILCEHKPPSWLAAWDQANLIVSTMDGSFLRSKWSKRIKMTHNELGGLTTASVHLQAYSSIDRKWIQLPPLQTLLTTVYSVASDTVDMGTKVSGPKVSMLMGKSRVQRMAPNTYHGGGLYPLDGKPGVKPFFILRSVLVNGWVRRRLTTVEEWTVKDAPVRIVKLAQEAGEDMNRLWKSLRPGRCLEHGLRHLLSGIGVTDRDGRISKKLLTFGRAEKEPPTGVSVKRGIAKITRSLNETSLRKESKKLKHKRISAF
ncbi:unnamed protein product [Cylindrotheca closterium]|uniref:Uncharacterized protein n=1 Tax=Cylindrotheca closterium TaxID=2856 RepID=A0AAD2CHP5_9STRA|nr:unnamed protein product [Cylindrotheca closterium]